jgi:chemotaxis protein histidine kinase CheA
VNFANELHDLTLEFIDEIPARINAIEQLWRHSLDQTVENTVILAMRDEAHKLAGTAAAYGLTPVSKLAWNMQNLFEDLVTLNLSVNSQKIKIDALFQLLKNAYLSVKKEYADSVKPIVIPTC